MLREKIDHCDGVIQLVGHAYGFEPQVIDPEFGRLSYTQFELAYARKIKKRTWVVFVGDECTRDTPIDQLDLPLDPNHPDPAGYQRERYRLQAAWREKLRSTDELHHEAISDIQLELKIERLKDDLHELLKSERRWRQVMMGAIAAVVLLAVAAVGMILTMRGDQVRQKEDFLKLQELAESDIGIPFAEVRREDVRPELVMFDSIYQGVENGIGWSVAVKTSERSTKTLGQPSVKVFHSLAGQNYPEGMQALWFRVGEAWGNERLFLKFRNFDGEEIGPFQYDMDFGGYALAELRKRLESSSNLMTAQGMGWRWSYGVRNGLPAVDRIEYAFDPEFRGAQSISVPGGEFAERFGDDWALSLRFLSEPILPPDPETDRIHYRFIYRDGVTGKRREAALRRSPALAQPGPAYASPSLPQSIDVGDLGKQDIKVSISSFRAYSGWAVTLKLPPAIYQQLSQAKPLVEVSYSLDGESYSRVFSSLIRVPQSAAFDTGRLFVQLNHSKTGEVVGPFEYPLDFEGVALRSMKADLVQQRLNQQQFEIFRVGSGWMTLHSYAWDQFLPVLSKVEFSLDPDLNSATTIEIPETKLKNYWSAAWREKEGLAESYDLPRDAKAIYFRLTYREDQAQSRIRSQPLHQAGGLGGGGVGGF